MSKLAAKNVKCLCLKNQMVITILIDNLEENVFYLKKPFAIRLWLLGFQYVTCKFHVLWHCDKAVYKHNIFTFCYNVGVILYGAKSTWITLYKRSMR